MRKIFQRLTNDQTRNQYQYEWQKMLYDFNKDAGKNTTRDMALHGPAFIFTVLSFLEILSTAMHLPSNVLYYGFYFV